MSFQGVQKSNFVDARHTFFYAKKDYMHVDHCIFSFTKMQIREHISFL